MKNNSNNNNNNNNNFVSPLPVIQPVRLGRNYSVAVEFHLPEELVTDFQPNPILGCKWWGHTTQQCLKPILIPFQKRRKVPSPRQMELLPTLLSHHTLTEHNGR